MQLRIQEIIAQKNSPDEISEDLAELRRAKKEVFSPEGNIIEVKDNATRLGAVQTCLKVAGAFQDQQHTEHKTINFNINAQSEGVLSSLSNAVDSLARLNEKLRIDHANA